MAYRQLCAVTFVVLGLVAAGCGGSTTTAGGSPAPGEQPPSNQDQAPTSKDQAPAPSSSDQAPSNADAPPGSADAPAGTGASGSIGALCDQLCSSLAGVADRCSNGMGKLGVQNLCSDTAKCQMQVPANFPCQNEAVALFSCLIDNLDALCTASNQGSGGVPQQGTGGSQTIAPPSTTLCQDVLKTFTTCAEANAPPDTVQVHNCSAAGGCECQNDCLKCQCQAGTDFTKLEACATTNACAMP